MKTELFLQIEEAQSLFDCACEISDTICELSRRYQSTATLLAEYRKMVIANELQWQKIEAHPDYHFNDRDEARAAFLRAMRKEEAKT